MPKLSSKAQRDAMQFLAEAQSFTVVDAFKPCVGSDRLFTSPKHQIVVLGGNKSGKTYQSLIKLALRTTPEMDKYGNRTGWVKDPYVRRRIPNRQLEAWVSCYSNPVQRKTIQPSFNKIFKSYVGNNYVAESGVYRQAKTEIATITFLWQESGWNDYTGGNIDLIMWDEPHERMLYHEMISRFAQTEGYIWGGATLVVDSTDPDAIKKIKYIEWMHKELIEPWEKDPSTLPELDIVYFHTKDNPHINYEFQQAMWASLSESERYTRETGRYYRFIGNSLFNREMLIDIENYLRSHPEESRPDYGFLEYDDTAKDDFSVVFNPSGIYEFPQRPDGEFVIKIWEHPMGGELYVRPEYYIGADVAEGVMGGDYSSAYVRRADTRLVVAALHGHLSEIEFTKQLILLGMYYHDVSGEPAMLAVESNQSGKTVISYLITGHDQLGIRKYGIHRMYHRPLNSDLDKGLMLIGTQPGWLTTNHNRGYLLTAMRKALIECHESISKNPSERNCPIPDIGWITEAIGFIRNNSGKFEATPGVTNDDRLMSLAICDKCIEQYYRSKTKTVKKKEAAALWQVGTQGIILNIEEATKRARTQKSKVRMVY